MLPLTILATLTHLALTLAAPTPATTTCNAKIEELDWRISNLTIFTPASSRNSSASSISFHFCDINDRLQLDTTCTRNIPAGGPGLVDADTYYPCESGDVRFIYGGSWVGIERAFEDDCLGPYPYNSAIAFGREDTEGVSSTTFDGVTYTQAEMFIKITEET